MTREEAIIILTNTASLLHDGTRYMKPEHEKQFREAYEMAISALQAQEVKHSTESSLTQKRLDNISRTAAIDALRDEFKRIPTIAIRATHRIERLPSEQPEIIRCKDCMHNGSFDTDCPIDWAGKEYCNFAERR